MSHYSQSKDYKYIKIVNQLLIRLVLGSATLSLVYLFGQANWPQSSFAPPSARSQTSSTPGVNLPFNRQTDRKPFIPRDRRQSDRPIGNVRVVIGKDERIPVMTQNFPWSAIGRLEWDIDLPLQAICTATLIAPDWVITNAHCLMRPTAIDPKTQRIKSQFTEPTTYQTIPEILVFKPNLIRGRSAQTVAITSYVTGWTEDSQDPADDWALLKLDRPIGQDYGYLGWRVLDFSDLAVLQALDGKIKLVGYAGDFPTEDRREFGIGGETASVDRGCSILAILNRGPLTNTLIHDCDTNPGASGGPIFARFQDGNYYLVGLHARSVPLKKKLVLPSGETSDVLNGGVLVSRWAARVPK